LCSECCDVVHDFISFIHLKQDANSNSICMMEIRTITLR